MRRWTFEARPILRRMLDVPGLVPEAYSRTTSLVRRPRGCGLEGVLRRADAVSEVGAGIAEGVSQNM